MIFIGTIALCMLLFLSMGSMSKASEASKIAVNTVHQLAEDTQLRTNPDAEATKVCEVKAGAVVIVTAYDGGEWCEVSCKGNQGYVPITMLTPVGDSKALAQEFENLANDYENTYEEMLEIRRQERNSRIWGCVIIALVVAIFAVGIVSAIKKNKLEQMQEQSENTKEA